jgi:hypothetical protein
MADYLADLEEEESTMEDVWTIRDHPRLDIWEGNDEIMDDEVERGSHSRLSPLARLSPLEEDHHGGNYAFQDDYSISTGGNGRSHEYTSDEMMSSYSGPLPDPIRLKGVGGTTLFGLNNRFDDDFPSYLVGKVAPEEFHSTMNQINSTLHKSIPFNLRCLICGCLCCCCTLGISLGPVLYLNKRVSHAHLKKSFLY